MCFACAYMLCVHYGYAPVHFIRFSLEILDFMYLIYTSHRMRLIMMLSCYSRIIVGVVAVNSEPVSEDMFAVHG